MRKQPCQLKALETALNKPIGFFQRVCSGYRLAWFQPRRPPVVPAPAGLAPAGRAPAGRAGWRPRSLGWGQKSQYVVVTSEHTRTRCLLLSLLSFRLLSRRSVAGGSCGRCITRTYGSLRRSFLAIALASALAYAHSQGELAQQNLQPQSPGLRVFLARGFGSFFFGLVGSTRPTPL